jgi:two-component system, OmpR family, osmolarity sensor histidine kinase EnvZ
MQSVFVVLKRYMPITLFGRALLILLLPIVLLQVVAAALFVQRHYDSVTEQMAGSIARELNFAIRTVEEAPDAESAKRALARMSGPLGFGLVLDEGARIEPSTQRALYDVTGGVIAETLRELVHRPMAVDLVSYDKHVDASVATSKGALRVLVPRRRMNASNPHQLLVWISVSTLVLTGIAIPFLRNQVRPIRELALAAQSFGRGRSHPFRPAGAEEVRHAGAAFVEMRGRIERHVEQRTRMLSGVSHDLRTPLTRMKLALAVADETPETSEIARDIAEMERMLAGFLAFARGEGGEPAGPASPVELAEEVAADARRQGASVQVFAQLDTPDAPLVEMRRSALKRGLANLVENAAAYARRVALSVRLTRRFAEFVVEDDGPGIPEDKRDEVLKPFTRLDEARNQDIAGTGLGLSIALDIARSHGGSLKLDASPRLGGLRATMMVPR